MADKKISQLTSLAQGDIATTTDVLAIVDTSATETKKATPAAIVGAAAAAGLTNVDINSGAIDGTTIGANSAAAGTFTNLTASGTVSFSGATVSNGGSVTTVDINGGTIDGASVGASSASSGAFTTLSASGNVTLSGGTANGVLYLNGSKVATSGSALVFDGTNLGIGTSSPASKLDVTGAFGTGTTAFTIYNNSASSASNIARIDFRVNNTFSGNERVAAIWGLNPIAGSNNGGALVFGVSANGTSTTPSEVARFDQAGNLGIGTSSPAFRLHVSGSSSQFALVSTTDTTSTTGVLFGDSASNTVGRIEYVHSDDGMRFYTSGTAKATLDSSGNLGLGVTPSAWSGGKWMQFVSTTAVGQQGNGTANLMCNAYESSGNNFSYIASVGAARYNVQAGTHAWFTAPSGTAGNAISFTQAMTLDASGNLFVGATGQAFAEKFRMYGNYAVFDDGTYTGFLGRGTQLGTGTASDFAIRSQNALAFLTNGANERARIDASGNFGVGTSSPSAFGLLAVVKDQTADTAIVVGNGGTSNAATTMSFVLSESGAKQGWFRRYRDGTANTEIGFSDALLFTGNVTGTKAERARITTGGDLLVGTTTSNARFTSKSAQANIAGYFYQETQDTGQTVAAFASDLTSTNSIKCRVFSNGNLENTNGSYGTLSDARLKQDVVDAPSQWDDIKAVRFRKYRMKAAVAVDQNAQSMLGVVAQELEQVCPGLVEDHADENGETVKSVKSSILLMKAAVALQEAMARIEQLEAKVAALEAK